MLKTVSFFEVLKNAKGILKNPLPFHHRNFEKYGDVFKVNLGFGNSVLFVRDAGLAKHMLQKQHKIYHKSPLQSKELARYVGEGLLTANGEKWLKQRRLIQPAFHKKKLEKLLHTMHAVIDKELDRITENDEIDVFPLMSDLAFKVVAKSLFSYKGDDTVIKTLQHITEKAQKTLIKEIRQPYKRWWFYLNGTVKRTLNETKEARDLLLKLIEERKNAKVRYDDLLDMLLDSRYDDGTAMNNEQLIDEILILFTAGHETTSNALSFVLLLLAQHQDQQQMLYESLQQNQSCADLLNLIQNSAYTTYCIEETMRLYPPAYFSDRVAIENDDYNGLAIKKGTTLLISFFEIHRNSGYWKTPEIFNPMRFKKGAKSHSDHYFPFGAGPRMCIGSNFAMYEMVLVVNKLIKNYKLTTNVDQIKFEPLITLKPKSPYIQFVAR